MNPETVSGTIYDVIAGRAFPGEVVLADGRIAAVRETKRAASQAIVPGFVDSHVHIESSLCSPREFARLAARHGVTAAVADPHEIANVCGVPGVEWMVRDAASASMTFAFGAPSCVPATPFETSGAVLSSAEVATLLRRTDVTHLAEMMNFPGVINGDPEVVAKLTAARSAGKPVDGHCPGLSGDGLRKYLEAGISTDHECSTIAEAREKIKLGLRWVMIREGSAARNFDALLPLVEESPDRVMFCTDDAHPDFLVRQHIDAHVRRCVRAGINPLSVLRAATLHPVRHYRLPCGLLQPGDPADFVVLSSLEECEVLKTYWHGTMSYSRDGGNSRPADRGASLAPINQFRCSEVDLAQLRAAAGGKSLRVIKIVPGELLTECWVVEPTVSGGEVVSDSRRDILKLAVKDRYRDGAPAVGFVSGFGIRSGAFACSIGHDSHNVVGVGADDASLCAAMNAVIRARGGMCVVAGENTRVLKLPVAGLMADDEAHTVAGEYERLSLMVTGELGSGLAAPFMSLSFLPLLVIPELKLSDQGLFDGKRFEFVGLFAD